MARNRSRHLAAIVATALAAVFLTPMQSEAGTKCKGVAVSSASLTEDSAVSSWSEKVRRSYGAPWANFGLARHKSFSQTALPASTLYFVTATPCRKT